GPGVGSGSSSSRSVSGPPGPWERSARINASYSSFPRPWSYDVMRRRLFADFLGDHSRRQFDQLERAVVIRPVELCKVGDDHVDDVIAGQRKGAFRDALGVAVLGRVFHHDDDLLDP